MKSMDDFHMCAIKQFLEQSEKCISGKSGATVFVDKIMLFKTGLNG